jgi:farnesyl-diphosphate farnesyltransferase
MARVVSLESAQPDGWTALPTCDDLTAYEYYVAGTVGCMLNELIQDHITGDGGPRNKRQRNLAISFGLGLQGTNIIQDLSIDRARGWSYLPEEIATRYGTATRRLHEARERPAAMMAIREMAWRAMANLDDGLEFVLLLPRRHPRIRLFCLWPLLLAVRTLRRLVSSPDVLLDRVRITRSEVRELTRGSLWRCLSNAALKKLYGRERMGFVVVSGMDVGPAGNPVLGQREEG